MSSQISPSSSQLKVIQLHPLNDRGDLMGTKTLDSVGVAINTELNLYICLSCGSAHLHSSDVNRGILKHLRSVHSGFGSAAREHIVGRTHGLHIVKEFPSIELSQTPRIEFSGISISTEHFGCTQCPYAGSQKPVQKHMHDVHNISKSRPVPGVLTQVLNTGAPDAKACIRVVAWHPEPVSPTSPQSSFPLLTPSLHPTPTTCSPPPCTQRPNPGKTMLDQIMEFDAGEYQPEELPNARMISPWLLRTGWHKLLEPYSEYRDELIDLVSVPKEEEFPALKQAVTAYFRNATSLIAHTNEVVLQYLNSADPDKKVNNTPLHEHQQGDTTFDQYINVIIRLVSALLRAPEHYEFPMNDELKIAVAVLLHALVDSEDFGHHCVKLHQVFLELWKTEWEATEFHVIHDPTMCFLALFSLEPSGEFADAKKTTGPIAKLCWGIKLCLLRHIHFLVDSGHCTTQMEAFELIAPFVVEHKLSTFHHLRSLTHYATSIVYSTIQLPTTIWVDRDEWTELLYLGHRISLNQLQEILGKLEEEIVILWQNHITLGIDVRINYGDLADNLTNRKPGYSFITDPLNPFVAHKYSLSKAVLNDMELEQCFVYQVAGIPGDQLNIDAARKWLSHLAEFEGLLLLYLELTPGATIRGTELVSMLSKNTAFRVRNMMGFAKFVALIRQYDKTTNNAQKDRLIPHAASGLVADFLIQLHALARPFAEFLAAHIFPDPDDKGIVAMYGDLLFMDFGRPFTSDKLSRIMAQWSGPVLGWNMTIAPYRQINTMFRRKLCSGFLDEEDDSENLTTVVLAMQAGHSGRVDRQHYGLSHNALLGVTEEVLFAFLQASVVWQKVLRVVPGGLALPYHKATREHFPDLELQLNIKKLSKTGAGDPIITDLLANLLESQHAMVKNQETMLKSQKTLLVPTAI
ncbi:hypothetical protein B0H12DRAFT_1242619 [Mycena haematopus]|nr:hypothetical protein B0H12DRAFT_1242619 [Mycena haematopus]